MVGLALERRRWSVGRLGDDGACAAHLSPLLAESSESNPDAFKEAYTVDESKWEMPADLKAKYA